MRHGDPVPYMLAEAVNCSVINAGDSSMSIRPSTSGRADHPRRKGALEELEVAICRDIAHSRVARSNIHLLSVMGARIRVVAPPTLVPAGLDRMGVEIHHSMERGLRDVDIVMMLRLQTERMQAGFVPSAREYFKRWGLDRDKLSLAKPDVLTMHPGPMNRGTEIASEVADDIDHSVIQEQVEMGVAVRMACLEALTRTEYRSNWTPGR